jgi:SAM-dependent methyltransferase
MSASKLRQTAKRIGPLYWLAGLVRYATFKSRLRTANRAYARARGPAIPPPALRHRVHGAFDEASYRHVGGLVASKLIRCLNARGVVLDNLTVLDFGCGPGRVATELKKLAPSCHLVGSDSDPEAIEWAQDHLRDVASFETNDSAPPTRHANGRFDVIYAISLFTHLDEALQDAWLAELARILKPGGLLLATTHGRHSLASCTAGELRELDALGFAHRIDRKGRFKLDGLPDSYQTTFHTPEYIARSWSRFLAVVDLVEAWLGDQDLIVLRRREA